MEEKLITVLSHNPIKKKKKLAFLFTLPKIQRRWRGNLKFDYDIRIVSLLIFIHFFIQFSRFCVTVVTTSFHLTMSGSWWHIQGRISVMAFCFLLHYGCSGTLSLLSEVKEARFTRQQVVWIQVMVYVSCTCSPLGCTDKIQRNPKGITIEDGFFIYYFIKLTSFVGCMLYELSEEIACC